MQISQILIDIEPFIIGYFHHFGRKRRTILRLERIKQRKWDLHTLLPPAPLLPQSLSFSFCSHLPRFDVSGFRRNSRVAVDSKRKLMTFSIYSFWVPVLSHVVHFSKMTNLQISLDGIPLIRVMHGLSYVAEHQKCGSKQWIIGSTWRCLLTFLVCYSTIHRNQDELRRSLPVCLRYPWCWGLCSS